MLSAIGHGQDPQHEHAKALLPTISNGVAMLLFIGLHAVYWRETILMVVASMTGILWRSLRAEDQAGACGRDHHRDRLNADCLLLCQTVSALVAGFDNSTIFADGVVAPHGTEAQFHDQQGKCQKEGHGVRQNDWQ